MTATVSLDSFTAMFLLSATPGLAGSYIRARISAPCAGATGPSTSRPYILPSNRWRGGRMCACVGFSSRWSPIEGWRRSVLAPDLGAGGEISHSRPPLRARSEEELLSYVRKEFENGRISSDIAHGLEELYHNYRNAVMQSGLPEADELILSNMTVVFDRILIDIENPFMFPPCHKATREPFDYYMFGQNYIRPLLDFKKSYVGNISLFVEMEQHLLQVFVAGDRVVTDPLCKPFSMGRNLLCVYSKKHLFDDPELVDLKKRANTRSLKEMAVLLKSGSQIVWIAPSGGRDRPDPETGKWFPAPFDASSLDNMRRLAEHSGVPGHLYPLALLCYDIMPPPAQVEKELGEQRKLSHHGVGLSVATEINFNEVTVHCENKEEAKQVFSVAMHHAVREQYNILKSAIYEQQGLDASDSMVSLSQPWLH